LVDSRGQSPRPALDAIRPFEREAEFNAAVKRPLDVVQLASSTAIDSA
jgi:hypothetical protein